MTPSTTRALLAAAFITAALSQGATAQAPKPDCAAATVAKPTLPATIPIEVPGNHVAFWVCRGDQPLMFFLDTGAGRSIFDLGTAKRLGVALTSSFRATGAGAGSSAASNVRKDAVTLPGAGIVVPIATAIDLASVAGPSGETMQGILGADFISRYIIALDYQHMQMRVYDRAAFTYDGPGTIVPFALIGAFIHVRGGVGLADSARVPGDFVVDVGGSGALALAKPFVERNHLLERVGPTVHRPAVRGVGGVTFADVARVPSLAVGGVEVKQVIANLYGDSAGVFSSSRTGDGTIGGDILRHYTVYFDYRGLRMIWEPNETTSEPFEADMSGLQLTINPDRPGLTVDFVVAQSPAGELGFRKGDVVLSVDGKPVDNAAAVEELRKRFRRDGEHVSITLRRGMTPMVFELVTRRMV